MLKPPLSSLQLVLDGCSSPAWLYNPYNYVERSQDRVLTLGHENPCGGVVNLRLSFLGAAGTVTGSRYLLESANRRILIDCGLFQGYKQLRLRNWSAPPFDPASIDAVILTHAHIDHSGYIPRLVKQGFKGPVFCSLATLELCRILLPDSGYLQEEDARFANLYGFSKHH